MILGFSTDDLIVAMAALAAAANVVLLYRTLLMRDPLTGRIKSLVARRQALREGLIAPKRRARAETGRGRTIGLMRQVLARLRLLGTRQSQKASLILARAGWRSRDALVLYFFLKLALPFVLGGTALVALYVLKLIHLSETMSMLASLGSVVVGAYGPDVYVYNTITKRKKKLQKGLPDTLDLLVICAEAGQTLDAALARVAREMAASCPEIADEIGLTALELGLLPERRQALDHLNSRTDMPSIRGVVNTLMQTERYGTPLASSLRVLAAEFRHERLMKAEEKAAKLPAKLTVPMIVFIMPALFVVLIGPAVIRTIDMLSRL